MAKYRNKMIAAIMIIAALAGAWLSSGNLQSLAVQSDTGMSDDEPSAFVDAAGLPAGEGRDANAMLSESGPVPEDMPAPVEPQEAALLRLRLLPRPP